MKRKNQKWLPLVCVLAAVLLLLGVVALVLSDGKKPNEPDQTTVGSSQATESVGGQTQRPGSLEDMVIETPFCRMVYPGLWSEHLVVEQVSGTEHDVNFYAEFEGTGQIFLFSITFSPEQDGALMVIQGADGNDVGVYLHMTEVTADLGDEQMNEIYSMQEAANDLLDQLS